MTHSSLTNGVQITSDSSPRGSRIDRFILHHAATTSLSGILSLFQPGGRTVSANYALGNDGTLILTVDEDRRAWTSASSYWDGRAVTIEVANSSAGGSWPVSDATFDKLARLIADVATRYGFPINDDTILTHQELYLRYGDSYGTACPGDMQRRKGELLNKANYYRTFPGVAGLDAAELIKDIEEYEMKIYANTEIAQPWVVAGPNVWRQIPGGYADYAIEAFGEPVRLSNVAFDLARKICTGATFGTAA